MDTLLPNEMEVVGEVNSSKNHNSAGPDKLSLFFYKDGATVGVKEIPSWAEQFYEK